MWQNIVLEGFERFPRSLDWKDDINQGVFFDNHHQTVIGPRKLVSTVRKCCTSGDSEITCVHFKEKKQNYFSFLLMLSSKNHVPFDLQAPQVWEIGEKTNRKV